MIILGVGSNWGDRLSFLRRAIHQLRVVHPDIQVQAISPIYESPALLPPNAPLDWDRPFLNLNVLCSSHLESMQVLRIVKTIETALGRQNRGRWAPREVDIDILARDQEVYSHSDLIIPHPGLQNRPFAFLPFADLAPDWEMPNQESPPNKRISELCNANSSSTASRSNLTLTETMGILNITPDSFSDGGIHNTPETALNTAQAWCQAGVRVLDIGAESTRPGATPISTRDECERLAPILDLLKNDTTLQEHHVILSLDTRNPDVAKWATTQGIHWINDVSGFENSKMAQIVAESGMTAIFMHSLSVPSRKDLLIPEEVDSIDLILKWGEQKIRDLLNQGLQRENLIFDPGLGFGKTTAQNWEIIKKFRRFHELGVKTLVGHSRKSFLSTLGPAPAHARDLETAALSIDLFEKGVDYLRVHDPLLNQRALTAWSHANGVVRCRV